ncbi:MAG: hypothetical protein IT422_13855 [Pirellulaceae bacterium]|nr:hypothetical protein [Pirellulaceae bacterium]
MNRSSTLDEPADLKAEHGSPSWARGVARKIQFEVKKLDSDVSLVQSWIEVAAENEVWRILGYVSLDTFLVAEANVSQSIIDSIRNAQKGTTIAEARANPAAKHGEIGNGRVGVSKSTLPPGTNNKRILANLARDHHDELLDAIEAGEMSVNQAAIRAGYRKNLSHAEKCVAAFRKAENQAELLGQLRQIVEAAQ